MTLPVSSLPRLALSVLAAWAFIATSGCTRTPADDSAEAGFARDMATHHAQAVEMAFILRDASIAEPLRTLAADIIVTQSAQRGMFMAWLQLWDLPQASAGPRMVWMSPERPADESSAMNHVHDEGGTTGLLMMAGMATNEELDALRRATGHDAEVLFLQLMIRHHEGGVLMARALLERSSHDVVVPLADRIVDGQTGEIATMTEWLKEREAQPLPSLLR
jgi:uncharacterized protein (DUF305 family)